MIVFELFRQLDVRMYQTIAFVDPTFGPCAKYIMQDDSLVLLGTDHSVRLNMANKDATVENPYRNFNLEGETVLWFSENSGEGYVVRAINHAFREWLDVDAFPTDDAFHAAIDDVNKNLTKYNLRILADSNGMSIYHDEKIISFEQAIEIIIETDVRIEQSADLNTILASARSQKVCGMLANAVPHYEQILRISSRADFIYTVAAYELAECYYFIGNYERAVSLYYRCNLEYIADEDDFYIHVGHALLDEKMKKYEREIKIYYRAKIDPDYSITHKDAVEGATREVGAVYREYEDKCLEVGRTKYASHRNHLPIGADDIDELMAVDPEETEAEEPKIKVYEGIKLKEPVVYNNITKKSENEMFSEALDLFIAGEYQKAFDIYYLLSQDLNSTSAYYTWAQFQLGKLYCIFDDYEKAKEALLKCDVNLFGIVYRQDDFLVLFTHIDTVNNDFESDPRYRKLIRGRFDFYFAQYDKEYNQMLRDHRLIKKFVQYEKECKADSIEYFQDSIVLDDNSSAKKSKWKLFGKR